MKRCLAGLLCLLLCISAVPVSAVDGSGPSPWAEAEVNTAISIGLVPEELQSDYQQNITRDEFAQLAVTLCMAQLRYVGGPEQFLEDYRRYFRDEAGNAVDAVPAAFSDATFWGTLASALGVVQGRGDGTFDPDGLITRQEAAVMVSRAAELCGLETGMDTAAVRNMLAQFPDYMTSAEWARVQLAFCYREGILSQTELNIRPQDAVTRAEVAQMLFNLLSSAELL